MSPLRLPPTFGRNDKVARRVVAALEDRLATKAAEGVLFVFAIAAPIRKPALLIDALTVLFSDVLARGAPADDREVAVHGNTVRFRLVARSDASGEVVGCVQTGRPDLESVVAVLQRS